MLQDLLRFDFGMYALIIKKKRRKSTEIAQNRNQVLGKEHGIGDGKDGLAAFFGCSLGDVFALCCET